MLDLTNVLGVKITSEPWDGASRVPYMLAEAYTLHKVTLDGLPCVFAAPCGEVAPIQTLLRNIKRIREVEALPVVLKLNGLSGERRKALIEARIPFVAAEQAYLPFLGVVLNEKMYTDPKPREKLMPSAQLVLFSYLYQNSEKLHTNGLNKKLGLSAMQITRAVRQLQKLNLVKVSKEGVQVVISGKTNPRALFESAAAYLLDPVREILYVPRGKRIEGLPVAGLTALSEMSMLSAPLAATLAYFSRTDRLIGENTLTDREKQVRVEVWKYSPTALSNKQNVADPLSVVVSLSGEHDERVVQAIEEILKNIWR